MSQKIGIVTGDGGGIGSAICAELALQGYQIIALDKSESLPSSLEHIADLSFQSIDLQRYALDDDYRSERLETLVAALPENPSSLVLVNNAAVQILEDVGRVSSTACLNTFSVNAVAPLLLTSDLSEELIEASGCVVNISSIHASQTKRAFSMYAASKAALESLTRSTALELAPFGVRVLCLAPAAIKTKMLVDGFAKEPEKLSRLKEYHPAKILGGTEDIAKFVAYLAVNDDRFLNGAVIRYDGAISAVLHDPI